MPNTPDTLYSFPSELPPDEGYENFVPVTVFYTMEDIGVTMIPSEDIQPVIQSVVSTLYGELVEELRDSDVISLEKQASEHQDTLNALSESARLDADSV
jgi:hypothetical protein